MLVKRSIRDVISRYLIVILDGNAIPGLALTSQVDSVVAWRYPGDSDEVGQVVLVLVLLLFTTQLEGGHKADPQGQQGQHSQSHHLHLRKSLGQLLRPHDLPLVVEQLCVGAIESDHLSSISACHKQPGDVRSHSRGLTSTLIV